MHITKYISLFEKPPWGAITQFKMFVWPNNYTVSMELSVGGGRREVAITVSNSEGVSKNLW